MAEAYSKLGSLLSKIHIKFFLIVIDSSNINQTLSSNYIFLAEQFLSEIWEGNIRMKTITAINRFVMDFHNNHMRFRLISANESDDELMKNVSSIELFLSTTFAVGMLPFRSDSESGLGKSRF